MRIRKRSIEVLSSSRGSISCDKTCTSNSPGRGDEEEEKSERVKQDFLFPLVVAVMDVQAKAEAAQVSESLTPQPGLGVSEISVAPKPGPGTSEVGVIPQGTRASGFSRIESGVHRGKRPGHNWRSALLRFDAESEPVKVGVEDDRINYRRNGIMRKAGDKFEPLTTRGLLEKTFKPKEEGDLGLFTTKKETNSPTKCDLNAARRDYSDANCSQTLSQNDNPKLKSKANISDKDDDNGHGGSRCRRRNGRGWRCSQRTLVGYSLCEHHLGKSRFRSINSSKGLVPATSKGSKFKKLHLIHAASCKVDN